MKKDMPIMKMAAVSEVEWANTAKMPVMNATTIAPMARVVK